MTQLDKILKSKGYCFKSFFIRQDSYYRRKRRISVYEKKYYNFILRIYVSDNHETITDSYVLGKDGDLKNIDSASKKLEKEVEEIKNGLSSL